MSSTAVPAAHRHASPALRRFAWGVLVYFTAVVLWGAVTRATGAGDGCGNHWPLCNGTVVQHSPSVDTLIEFTHRITSGISLFSIIGLLLWIRRATPRGHLARAGAWASVIFTLIEAVLGAFLVKLGLTAQSHSPLRAPYLALHFTNTLLLLAALTFTAHMLSRRRGYRRADLRVVQPFGAIACAVAVLIVGVTGSLAALGDTLFPAQSLGSAMAQDFSAKSEWIVRWRWMHPAIAFLACVFLIGVLVRAVQRPGDGDKKPIAGMSDRALAAVVLVLLCVQYTLGSLDVLFLAPLWLQVAHLLGADALWCTLIVLIARLTLEPAESGEWFDGDRGGDSGTVRG